MSLVHTIGERDGRWVRLVMQAPKGNLLSLEMVRGLRQAIDAHAGAPGLKWLTLEGAGGEFSFGAKIQEHLPEPMQSVLPETHALVRDLLACPVSTAALVSGRCLGGGFELALACDDIIAASESSFGLPEIALAAFPPVAAALLPGRVGASRACRAVLTGDPMSARYWHDAGLVSVVAPQATLLQAAGEWFDRHFAPRSAAGLRHAVEASRLVLRAQALPALEQAERLYLDGLLTTSDAVEGVQAWIDKRQPQWRDR
jgi:cyclohexa-1,5-dienecarbonyl-CoA hydratase